MTQVTKRSITLFACGFMISSSVLSQKAWDTIPNLPQHYQERINAFKKEKNATGKVVFIGNSITEGGNWKKLLKDSTVINRGISGDITFGMLNRTDEVIKLKPSKLFVLIGINDLYKEIPDEIVLQNIFTFIRMVKASTPQTKLFIQSILPVNKSFKNFPKNYDKEEHIATVNGQLKKLSKHFGYTYIDLHTQFTDNNMQLDEKYTSDGLHLNSSGYLHWAEILKSYKYL